MNQSSDATYILHNHRMYGSGLAIIQDVHYYNYSVLQSKTQSYISTFKISYMRHGSNDDI